MIRNTLWALLCASLCTTVFAQQMAQPATPSAARPDLGKTQALTLDVVVTDKAGLPVSGLKQQDFTLLDNKQPVPLSSFWAVDVNARTSAPDTEVILVLDAINADPMKIGIERQGVTRFLLANSGKLAQRTSLVIVSDNPKQLRSQTTTDGNVLAAWLEGNKTGLRTIDRAQGNWGRRAFGTLHQRAWHARCVRSG